ncbi:MAG: hypothetical protein ABI571_06795 [Actinomycetota bacterium]
MIEAAIVSLAALATLAYVLNPLRSGPRRDIPLTSMRAEDAEEKKRAALTALLDIEEERSIGKMSNADFDALRAEYEAEALEALIELDELDAVPDVDQDLEAEISALKTKMTCPSCGAMRKAGKACDECGAPG